MLESGSIIRVLESIYDTSIISNKWHLHFITVPSFYKIISITNNGSITAKDKHGNIIYLYAKDKNRPITNIYWLIKPWRSKTASGARPHKAIF